MRFIPLAALTITLGGCAASPELPLNSLAPGAQTPGAQAPLSPESTSEELRLVAVIDMQPVLVDPDLDSAPEPCTREYMTGSRILRTRCEPETTEAMQELEDHRIQWEIQHVRELRVREEEQRIEDELQYRREMSRQR